MRRQIILMSFIAIGYSQIYTQEIRDFISPGIKLGYDFGNDRGFTFGLECSFTRLKKIDSYGIVAAIDFHRELYRFHIGVEGSRAFGLEWGPSLIVDGGPSLEFGHSLTVFFGVLVFPYYTITFRTDSGNLYETGSYMKIPMQTSGGRIGIGK